VSMRSERKTAWCMLRLSTATRGFFLS
jgi:hypothetical protein